MSLRRITKHITDQNKTTAIAWNEATRHQTAGLPFCHAKRPEGLGAGAERQSHDAAIISNSLPRRGAPRNDGVFIGVKLCY